MSSSDDEYAFRIEVPASKVSAPFVSLKVNGVVCKFLVDSEASVNIVSSHAVKVFGVDLQPCGTRVYAFNLSAPLPVIGKFSALIESKCSAVDAEFLVVESETSLLGYTTANPSDCKCCISGEKRIPAGPKSVLWSWKNEEC